MQDYITYLRSMVGHEKVIMVASGVFVFDKEGRLLLQLRSDNNEWGHPGGFMEIGETVEDTARREVFEETGLELEEMNFFGIYSGVKHERVLANGDQFALVKIMFTCTDFKGELNQNNSESLQLKFFPLENLPAIWNEQKMVFDDLLSNRKEYYVR
ncbi:MULTISPECIES: NUDIX hydrolase [Bacillaceae]|uniref:NUDIX hydrolase n=1 Tax=Bacillaceae TaxID=186817 RepID=UPI000C76E3D4|nr:MULTISPECIES: NUDIX domain-containing protein [Bacillaceae]PLR66294.1 DNA mismatch repair protein MutT [Bacillus sp. UMB0893]QNG61736.1 NUDIX domain-containing protein [Bacillus sp. PAMC26568]